jgi:hypothetical protein
VKRDAQLAALLIGVALLAYVGAPPREFVYDDREAVQENPVVNGELPWTSAFSRDFWGRDAAHTIGTYRPIPVLVSRAAFALGGGKTWAFRGTSVLLHLFTLLATLFAFLSLTDRRGRAPFAVLIGLLLFSACTATSEAVLCIVGSADLLCAIAVVSGLMAHRRRGSLAAVGAGVAFLFALGSKESGVMAPVVWLALDALVPAEAKLRERLPRFALYAVMFVPYLFARHHALGALLLPWTNGPLHNPLVTVGFFARQLGAANIFVTKYLLGLLPWRRMFDCSANACGVASVADPLAWLGLVVWVALLVAPIVLRKRSPLAAVGLAWFVLFFLPGSNFLVAGPTIYGERLLYLPSMGLFLAVAVGGIELASWLGERIPRGALLAWAAFWIFLIGNVVLTHERQDDWSSNAALARSGLRYAPESAIVQVNLAVEARPLKDFAAVEEHARHAIAIDAREMPPHRELAAALFATGRIDEARVEFETAYRLRQDDILVFDYANFLGKTKQYDKGLAVVSRYLEQNPHHPELKALEDKLRRAAERSRAETVPVPP